MNPTESTGEIIKEILIRAPAERVFEALTDPRQRVAWWGAEGRFQATHMESDLRPGGAWLMSGTGMGGKPFTVRGEYRSIERPRLLEFTWLADWHEAAPPTVVRFDLDEKDGATTVRLTHSGFSSETDRANYQGWPWLLAQLQAHVQKKDAN
ncbi:MAG TPA: SRPBCC domain-containing protein [Isosphaeraceae bacterium]|jgi:uncharacterized protein YndB with AHSA1/START domain|nr:SRPBCC domain-containing protein [Isosphaeraceae bacterium]